MQLEIKGNKLGLQWGLGCFEIATEFIKGVSTVQDVMLRIENDSDMIRIAYAALQNWCDIQEINNPVSLRQFQAWLDEEPQETGTAIVESFLSSKYQGRVMSERYNELVEIINSTNLDDDMGSDKKKATKKKATSAK